MCRAQPLRRDGLRGRRPREHELLHLRESPAGGDGQPRSVGAGLVPVSSTRCRHRRMPWRAGSPEASLSARACLRLPRASANHGPSATWAALAGHTGVGRPYRRWPAIQAGHTGRPYWPWSRHGLVLTAERAQLLRRVLGHGFQVRTPATERRMTRATRRKNLELLLVHGGLKQVGCCIGRHKARFHKQRPRPKANRSPRGRWLRECSVHFARALSYQPSCARAKSEPDQVTFHQDLVAAVYRDLANASHLSIPGGRHAVPRNHDTFREPRPRQPVARARAALLSCRRWQLQGRLPSHRAAAEKFGE